MRRYLAVLWHDAGEPAIAAAALGLARNMAMNVACREDGLVVLVRDVAAFGFESLPGAPGGVVVGELHYRHGPHDAFDGSTPEMKRVGEICRDGKLGQQCWGSFLAIQPRCASRPLRVYHSAFSTLPAYYATVEGVLLVASDADLLKPIVRPRTTIDWRSVAMQLGFDDFAFRSTCLSGLTELRGGETLEWRPGELPAVRYNWTPWSFAGSPSRFASEELALENLERELTRCISACTSGLATSLLDLSGGLDSSILAALCTRNRVDLRAVNIFSEATEGDERGFARASGDAS